jgi:hypothetical protein
VGIASCLCSAVALVLYFSHAPKAAAFQTKNVTLFMQTLHCGGTTDNGLQGDEDEIYLLVAGKRSNGSEFSQRIPSSGHWSMDEDPPDSRQNKNSVNLWSGHLAPGESVEITIIVAEEDQSGKEQMAIRAASQAARNTTIGDPIIGTILKIAGLLGGFLVNTDDYPGAFAVEISNVSGQIRTRWACKEACEDKGPVTAGCPQNGQCGAQEFWLNNDGSHYRAFMRVRF